MIKPAIIIFSVFQENRPETANFENHFIVQGMLEACNIKHKIVHGVYNGKTELSFLVYSDIEATVIELCNQFNQECYLYSDELRRAYFKYPDGTIKAIGQLQAISETQDLDCYTYCPTLNQYFVAR